MRDRRDIGDRGDLDTQRIQRTDDDSRPGPGPLTDFQILDAALDGHLFAGRFGSDLGSKRGALAGTLEASATESVAHEKALFWRSVIVMMVLLKEAWTWATPSATFF